MAATMSAVMVRGAEPRTSAVVMTMSAQALSWAYMTAVSRSCSSVIAWA